MLKPFTKKPNGNRYITASAQEVLRTQSKLRGAKDAHDKTECESDRVGLSVFSRELLTKRLSVGYNGERPHSCVANILPYQYTGYY